MIESASAIPADDCVRIALLGTRRNERIRFAIDQTVRFATRKDKCAKSASSYGMRSIGWTRPNATLRSCFDHYLIPVSSAPQRMSRNEMVDISSPLPRM